MLAQGVLVTLPFGALCYQFYLLGPLAGIGLI